VSNPIRPQLSGPVIIPVHDRASIDTIVALARDIWTEYYTPIIGQSQVSYMLDTFQSHRAITRQIAEEGYLYYLIADKTERWIGYLSVLDQTSDQALFLSKFYLTRETRQRGFGREALRFVEELATTMKRTRIVLTVNKNNSSSIAAYEKMGFITIRAIVTDIGGGFVMDDYVMQKEVVR
jgi:RimJ/RimL family protein N-acetyltransferase